MPWGASPTGNLAVTGALGIVAFLAIEIGGMVKLGFKGYMGTIFPHIDGLPPAGAMGLSIFMAPIEVLSKFVKPFAFMVRLFGNMTAGHFVILTMFGIVFLFGHFGAISAGLGISAALVLYSLGHDAGTARRVPAGVCLCTVVRRVHRVDAARALTRRVTCYPPSSRILRRALRPG